MSALLSPRPLGLDAFAHVTEAPLVHLLRHWLDCRGDAVAPRRSAIDATAIAPILAGVWLCDYEPAGRRFRMRLAGETINDLYGRNITQCYFEEIIEPTLLDDMLRRYRRVVEEPAILHCAGHIYLASQRSEVGERLVLPLADESGALMHVIGASVYKTNLPPREGPITRESMVEIFTPLAATPTGGSTSG